MLDIAAVVDSVVTRSRLRETLAEEDYLEVGREKRSNIERDFGIAFLRASIDERNGLSPSLERDAKER